MGHYCAEMFPNGEDKTFNQRWANYQRECAIEISEIIKNNPIKFEEINIGDELTLYAPLKGLSKVRFDNEGEFRPIRELFNYRAQYYGWSFWELSWREDFKVYGKREVKDNLENKTSHQIRIDKPRDGFDFPRYWIGIKYFSKK